MEFSFTESAVGLVGFKICWFTACDRFWDLTDLLVFTRDWYWYRIDISVVGPVYDRIDIPVVWPM